VLHSVLQCVAVCCSVYRRVTGITSGEDAVGTLYLDRLEIFVELVHERDSGRNVESTDFLIGKAVAECVAERVAACCSVSIREGWPSECCVRRFLIGKAVAVCCRV